MFRYVTNLVLTLFRKCRSIELVIVQSLIFVQPCTALKLDSSAKRAIVLVPTTGTRALLDLSSLKAVGTHNAHNAGTAALLALGMNLGLDQDVVQNALPKLQPPPHRMEIGIYLYISVFCYPDCRLLSQH